MGISINSLEQALYLYDKSIDEEEKKAFRDAAIQRFEYSIELSWKTCMRLFGSDVHASKIAVREMARNNVISRPDLWLKFIDERNQTSHSYDEDVAAKVFRTAQEFLPEAKCLLDVLKKTFA